MPGAQPIDGERGLFFKRMACIGGESGAELVASIAVSSIAGFLKGTAATLSFGPPRTAAVCGLHGNAVLYSGSARSDTTVLHKA
jgi:hypothetical protein